MGHMSPSEIHPALLAPAPAERSPALSVAVIGGLSLLVTGFYIWAVQLTAQTDPLLSATPVRGYAVWIACTLTSAGLLWWHQRYPVAVFAAVFALHLTGAASIGNGGLGGVALPLWFSVYALAAFVRPMIAAGLATGAWVIAAIVQLLLAAAAGITLAIPEAALTVFGQGFFFIACFVLGIGMRAQRERARGAAERAALAVARTQAETAEAISRERNRMSRELHDLAAHQIIDVLLTTRAAQLTDPHPALAEIEQQTAEALTNVRAAVGALREGDAEVPHQPLTETVAHIIDRLAEERALRIEQHIEVSHEPSRASIATAASALSEALVNAASHAPGAPVAVAVRSDRETLTLRVRNPVTQGSGGGDGGSPPAGSGFGIVGAKERAQILSGAVDTGVDSLGDWVFSLTLPQLAAQAEVTR